MDIENKLLPQQRFIDVEGKVSPAVLAIMLGMGSVAQLYQYAQEGKIPDIKNQEVSYIEALTFMRQYFVQNTEVKKLKALEEARLKEEKARVADERRRNKFSASGDVEDTMHPLMSAKLEQNIKTEYAREAELWQKIAIKRGEYVAFAEKLDLVEGFLTSINDTLNFISNNYPEAQKRVDEAKDELYQLGVTLCEEADIDAESYIDAMLAKSIKEIQGEG